MDGKTCIDSVPFSAEYKICRPKINARKNKEFDVCGKKEHYAKACRGKQIRQVSPGANWKNGRRI